jgi:hypothetical protein
MKVEYLSEDWVKFQRYPCKTGFIDVWIGDSADNPNNSTKMNYNLNSIHKAYRLNGVGEWKFDLASTQTLINFLIIMSDTCTADEIWNVVFNS